jgi:hypothetical protein
MIALLPSVAASYMLIDVHNALPTHSIIIHIVSSNLKQP